MLCLGASASPMACFALPLPFDLRRFPGLPRTTHLHSAATVPSHGVEGRGHETRRSETGCLLCVLGLRPHAASWLDLPAVCGWGNKKNDCDTATAAAIATMI